MAPRTTSIFLVRLLAVTILIGAVWNHASAKSKSAAVQPVADTGLNVVRIRFDTLKLTPHETFVLMPVRWSANLPKPHDFRGFNVHFAVDPAKVTVSDFYVQGTAAEAMNGVPFTNTTDSDARFIILGSNEPDFSNPILFYVAVSLRLNPGDITPFHWTYIESPKYFKVDTIISEDGWIELPGPKSAAVTTRDTAMKADSIISIPVSITDLSGASIKQARIMATLDTSVFDLVGATPGASENAQVLAGLNGNTLTLDVTAKSSSTLAGNDVIAYLQLRARPRQDTICSAMTNGSFQALNSDAYIGTVSVWFGQVCVFGSRPESVVGTHHSLPLAVYPNPVTTVLHLVGPDAEPVATVTVYDVLGRAVFSGTSTRDWQPREDLPDGRYHVIVTDRQGMRREADVTLVR